MICRAAASIVNGSGDGSHNPRPVRMDLCTLRRIVGRDHGEILRPEAAVMTDRDVILALGFKMELSCSLCVLQKQSLLSYRLVRVRYSQAGDRSVMHPTQRSFTRLSEVLCAKCSRGRLLHRQWSDVLKTAAALRVEGRSAPPSARRLMPKKPPECDIDRMLFVDNRYVQEYGVG